MCCGDRRLQGVLLGQVGGWVGGGRKRRSACLDVGRGVCVPVHQASAGIAPAAALGPYVHFLPCCCIDPLGTSRPVECRVSSVECPLVPHHGAAARHMPGIRGSERGQAGGAGLLEGVTESVKDGHGAFFLRTLPSQSFISLCISRIVRSDGV